MSEICYPYFIQIIMLNTNDEEINFHYKNLPNFLKLKCRKIGQQKISGEKKTCEIIFILLPVIVCYGRKKYSFSIPISGKVLFIHLPQCCDLVTREKFRPILRNISSNLSHRVLKVCHFLFVLLTNVNSSRAFILL